MNKAVTGGAATADLGPDEQDLLLTVLFRLDGADLAAFERYETIVLPLLPAHGGVIERRIRTADDSIELHIVRFPDRAGFELYKSDEHRLEHAALLKQSGVTVEVHEGRELAAASFATAQAPPVEALDPRSTALLVIDVQHGFDDPCWGRRNNPAAEARIADLLAAWRAHAAPIYHAQHASTEPDSPLWPEAPGHAIKPEALPVGDEPVYLKQVNSAFIGTSLETDLRSAGIQTVVLVGLTTNHCVSTTTRMAANLGFRTIVVADATATFDRHGLGGRLRPAVEVHDAALSDLAGEFAIVAHSRDVARALAADASARAVARPS